MFIRSGKTASARRHVPIHHKLVPIIEARQGSEFLFPELNGSGKALVKRYTRFLDEVYPERREKGKQALKTFHSYRHFAISNMIRNGTQPHTVAEIVGHSLAKAGQTLSTYWHGDADGTLRKAIETIQL